MRKFKESDLKCMVGFYNSVMHYNNKEQLEYWSLPYHIQSTLNLFNKGIWKPIWINPHILLYIVLKRIFL